MKRFSFLFLLLLVFSGLFSATYFTRTSDIITPVNYEGIVYQNDSAGTSSLYSIRNASSFQVSVSGIDSASIIVFLYVGGKNFLPKNGLPFGIDTSAIDSAKSRFALDTITANGVYQFSGYLGTGVALQKVKYDAGVIARLNVLIKP
jgi:hypothetical protein